jgi:hypothetical protein
MMKVAVMTLMGLSAVVMPAGCRRVAEDPAPAAALPRDNGPVMGRYVRVADAEEWLGFSEVQVFSGDRFLYVREPG